MNNVRLFPPPVTLPPYGRPSSGFSNVGIRIRKYYYARRFAAFIIAQYFVGPLGNSIFASP